jgi:hypothetical protein
MTSKIKVDNIENQCGGAVVTKCGATTTISGSVVKADDIQAADGGNLINQCGTTITLGASGDTINLASGASQSGFGRTGTVDWQTGDIKTATFTAANGEGYFANTSGGAFTMNLPAGTAGNIVSVVDYTNTFQTNNLTVAPNGAQKIGGVAASNTLSTEGQSVTFVYVDDTEGWKNVQDSTSNVIGTIPYIVATGGTITCSGDYKIHTFTGPGTFTVCNVSNVCSGRNVVDYLVVAGGGGGNFGGGGAGGFRFRADPSTNPQSGPGAPRNGPAGLPVSAQGYPIIVGGGGPATGGVPGNPAVFSTITSTGGGGGGAGSLDGGSGAGATDQSPPSTNGEIVGVGNTPPVSPSQGSNGGQSSPGALGAYSHGGGGGAMAVGQNHQNGDGPTSYGGNGGAGAGITGFGASNGECSSCVQYFAGGGGGETFGPSATTQTSGGIGGGGDGRVQTGPGATAGTAGTANTGGGGGAQYGNGYGGGSGIVVIRYKFQ